ncbi:general transcription factor 3C polypeptide 2 isoform X2 [Poeciliopsis prolifica]|uniref:general transcription factor 3C polypeptide 2 isoform X2 n=1 Tax=Poeciliopsis prolifica TaxID=188132 RepID=UPI0024133182|nr:general transcription factor 3C polypeptide 2 isoform X2 [Poeciliopsis prolifica]
MDPVHSGQGLNSPSQQDIYLSSSSRGRQRKRNSKYVDFETDDTDIGKSVKQKSPQKSVGKRATCRKTPTKQRKTKTPEQQTTNGEKESPQTIAADCVDTVITPRKPKRAKKAQPVESASAAGDLPTGKTGGSVVENSVQQENGSLKPKRKYVRKKPVEEVRSPPNEEEPGPEPDEEVQSGGRRRRRAAKAALKYLQLLAKEVFSHSRDELGSKLHEDEESEQKPSKQTRGRKRKLDDVEKDFVPNMEDEDEEEEYQEGSDAESDFEEQEKFHPIFHQRSPNGKPHNGIDSSIIRTILDSAEMTKKFREENYSSWVFPEWVPSANNWEPVPENELEKYLPEELESAAFKVSRDNLTQEEAPLLRLSRFEAMAAHPGRWDMFLFAGGPVWALEWCPTPDGAPASQYIALACHRGMDDLHYVNQTYSEPGLVQLWDCGKLEYNKRPDSQPSLVYGLAQDKGFIWQLKWCPAGGWELPDSVRKAPFLPRLGLLAVATSSSVVTIYSLPHPDALLSNTKLTHSERNNEKPPIYKVRGVITLKLGCIKSLREGKSGQVLSMDWLPQKPHNIMAVGFYDGVVGLWDLCTKSSLLRVRESDRSLTLLPYRSILAHDNAVRALVFCPASRYLLTSAGEDRCLKTWDLRRLSNMVKVQKRHLTTELLWPLDSPGVLVAQESAFVPRSSAGVHYVDHYLRSYFAIPRSTSVWSLSYSDWLHTVMSADTLGDVILAILPLPNCSVKKTSMRRFPAYVTSLEPYEAEGGQNKGEEEERQEAEEREKPINDEDEGGRVGGDSSLRLQFQTYKQAVKKYYLHFRDLDMRCLTGLNKHVLWKRMQSTELTAVMNLDDMPLAALYKARFNPNMSSHVWIGSAGQTGLVRLHCARTFITPQVKNLISNHQAQFSALYRVQNRSDGDQTAAEQREQHSLPHSAATR